MGNEMEIMQFNYRCTQMNMDADKEMAGPININKMPGWITGVIMKRIIIG